MLRDLLYYNKFLTDITWLRPTATCFLMFLNFCNSIGVLAKVAIDRFIGAINGMRLESLGRKGLIAHVALFIGMLLSLGNRTGT